MKCAMSAQPVLTGGKGGRVAWGEKEDQNPRHFEVSGYRLKNWKVGNRNRCINQWTVDAADQSVLTLNSCSEPDGTIQFIKGRAESPKTGRCFCVYKTASICLSVLLFFKAL